MPLKPPCREAVMQSKLSLKLYFILDRILIIESDQKFRESELSLRNGGGG